MLAINEHVGDEIQVTSSLNQGCQVSIFIAFTSPSALGM